MQEPPRDSAERPVDPAVPQREAVEADPAPQHASDQAVAETAALSPPLDEPPPPQAPARQERQRSGIWAASLAGFLAGVIATALTQPVFTWFNAADDRLPATLARLDALEARLQEAAARPPPRDPRIDELAGRVAAGERALEAVKELQAKLAEIQKASPHSAPDPAIPQRLSALETNLKSLADTVAALRRSVDSAPQAPSAPAPAMAEMQALSQRVAALEQATESLQKAAAARRNEPVADPPARVAAAALALRLAVEAETPYAPELKAVQPFVNEPARLSALAVFAETGLPSVPSLLREGAALAAQARPPAPEPSGFWERVESIAGRIVRIRRTDTGPVADDQRGQLRAALARGDLEGSLARARALPQPARAAFEPWITKVEQRAAALAAAQALARQSLAALGSAREPASR